MKKQKNIFLSILLTLTAAAVLLTGCGSKDPASTPVSGPASGPASSSLATSAPSTSSSMEDAVEKNLSVTVVYGDETSEVFEFTSDQEFLRGALEEQSLVEGEESEYGLFVKTVKGVTANEDNQEWWCFTKNGEMLETGVDSTPIADGDHFEITLTVGY